jgi:predicted dehydrogenase
LEALLSDPEIDLICVCTSAKHYEFAKMVLEHGKHCLVEKPFTNTLAQAEELYALAEEKGVLIEPYHNRRYDSDFLTLQKVMRSGKLGELYEVELTHDYFQADVVEAVKTFDPYASMLYGHACHSLDQVLSLFGMPDRVQTEAKQLLGAGRMSDYYDIDLHYGTLKVSVKASYFHVKPRPSIVAYGRNGMFVKQNWDKQEAYLKLFYMPGQPGFGEEQLADHGVLTWYEDGVMREETVPTVQGDYACVYDALYDAIVNHAPQVVTKKQILTQMRILEEGIQGLR